MRGSRILCTLVLIASAAVFGLFNWDYYRSKDTLGPVISMDSRACVRRTRKASFNAGSLLSFQQDHELMFRTVPV